MTQMEHIAPGTWVRWSIHGMGGDQVREGRVVAFVPAGKDVVKDIYFDLFYLPNYRLRAQPVSSYDRYLVAVRRPSGIEWFYCPRVEQVEVVRGPEEEG